MLLLLFSCDTLADWFHLPLFCRHDKPTDPDDPLADQNIKDRFYGINDPVADKLMKRYSAMPQLEPPEDRTITTLYVGNLGDKIGEQELRYSMKHNNYRKISNISHTKFPNLNVSNLVLQCWN